MIVSAAIPFLIKADPIDFDQKGLLAVRPYGDLSVTALLWNDEIGGLSRRQQCVFS